MTEPRVGVCIKKVHKNRFKAFERFFIYYKIKNRKIAIVG
jgi:hypothetical protein